MAAEQSKNQFDLPEGSVIELETVTALSSKTSAKGDLVRLKTTKPVMLEDALLIPAGTEAVGQVNEAQSTGGIGMSGKLMLRPLYVRIGSQTVRLAGEVSQKGNVSAAGVLGLLLTPVVSGRSATIPEGTPMRAVVARTVRLSTIPLVEGEQNK